MSTPAQFRTEVRSTEGSSVRGGFTGQCETSVALRLRHVEFKSSAHAVTEAECGILRKEDICWSGKCLRGCCTGRGLVWAQDCYRLCLRSSSPLLVMTDAGVVSCGGETCGTDDGDCSATDRAYQSANDVASWS